MDSPYTQPRRLQYRGPSTSDNYNARIEENYKDISVLYNKQRVTQASLQEGYSRLVKEQISLERALHDAETRLSALEAGTNTVAFYHDTQVDNDRFLGTPYEVVAAARLTLDTRHGIVTLPKIETSSLSKLAFVDLDGNVVVPSTLETLVTGVNGTADSGGVVIDTSEPELAIARTAGRIWQRNVLAPSPNANGAQMFLYVKAPQDLFTTDKSNAVLIHPFPSMGTDIIEVAYTTKVNLVMDDSDGYTVLDTPPIHVGDPNAVGWVPPGGWNGDVAYNSGPRLYYCDPVPITGLRIHLGQRSYYQESGQYVYSYGMSALDLRYDKFLSVGKALIRFDAPAGHTITNVSDVQPALWNVAEASIPEVFSWRTIWETAYNSGIYTESPTPLSKRVWIEVTLSTTPGGATPALSGLTITYS